MMNNYGFPVSEENVRFVRDTVGTGTIYEFSTPDAGLVASHLATHPDTFFVAGSGVAPQTGIGPFAAGEPLLALEWVRRESKPVAGEPELNAYRYLFGRARDGSYRGLQVTQDKGGPSWGQVADHWMDYDTAAQRFPQMEML